MNCKDSKKSDFAKAIDTNIKTSYGYGIIEYIFQWSFLMESEIEKHNNDNMSIRDILKNCVKDTEAKADTMGLSGASFGFALGVMEDCWEYGDILSEFYDGAGFCKL